MDRASLEEMYGAVSVLDWADLDNLSDALEEGAEEPAEILSRINAAVAEAKAYFANEVGREANAATVLEAACVTRLAGYTLYQARGGEQDSTESGPGRMKQHYNLALEYLKTLKERGDSTRAAPLVFVY